MANLGQVKIYEDWIKIEDLFNIYMTEGDQFTIENKGYQTVLFCEKETEPIGKEGFTLSSNKKTLYTCKVDEYLWIRSFSGETEINVAKV